MNEEDVLVAIAMPPSARESIMIAEFAREKGARVIGITSSRVSTLAARSDHILVVPMQSPQFFESYVATIFLLEILIGFVVAKGGKEVVRRIESVEKCRRRLGEYWEHD
jgi:DNA-binding MurR/RpiR family transcriptional regulator